VTFDLLGREAVGLDLGAVFQRDARATVKAWVAFERVEPRERRSIDLVHLASHGVLAATHEPREHSEIAQFEGGLGARMPDEMGADEGG
jgi:hypothetical protein